MSSLLKFTRHHRCWSDGLCQDSVLFCNFDRTLFLRKNVQTVTVVCKKEKVVESFSICTTFGKKLEIPNVPMQQSLQEKAKKYPV
jgi:hypothetical protein